MQQMIEVGYADSCKPGEHHPLVASGLRYRSRILDLVETQDPYGTIRAGLHL